MAVENAGKIESLLREGDARRPLAADAGLPYTLEEAVESIRAPAQERRNNEAQVRSGAFEKPMHRFVLRDVIGDVYDMELKNLSAFS